MQKKGFFCLGLIACVFISDPFAVYAQLSKANSDLPHFERKYQTYQEPLNKIRKYAEKCDDQNLQKAIAEFVSKLDIKALRQNDLFLDFMDEFLDLKVTMVRSFPHQTDIFKKGLELLKLKIATTPCLGEARCVVSELNAISLIFEHDESLYSNREIVDLLRSYFFSGSQIVQEAVEHFVMDLAHWNLKEGRLKNQDLIEKRLSIISVTMDWLENMFESAPKTEAKLNIKYAHLHHHLLRKLIKLFGTQSTNSMLKLNALSILERQTAAIHYFNLKLKFSHTLKNFLRTEKTAPQDLVIKAKVELQKLNCNFLQS